MGKSASSEGLDQILNLAVMQYQSGQIKDAEKTCKKLLSQSPHHADGLHLMGVLQLKLSRYKEATKFLRQAILAKNDDAAMHSNLGFALQSAGELEEAITQYQKAITLSPDIAEAHMNLGNVYRALGDLPASLLCLERAVALTPDHAAVHYNHGLTLQAMEQKTDAMACYQRALALNPSFAEAYLNLGTALKDTGDMDGAFKSFQHALQLNPSLAQAYNNIGIILNENNFYTEAIEQYRLALNINPHDDKTHYNLGFALKDLKKLPEAIASYRTALKINPDNANALSELAHRLQHICDWPQLSDLESRLLALVRAGKDNGVSPFNLLNFQYATPADHLLGARSFAKKFSVPKERQFTHNKPVAKPKIRIGYVSSDFYQHATAYLMAELFERHDRNRFETYAYCYSRDDGSALRQRLIRSFDMFLDIRSATPFAAAKRIHEDQIDILIDLKGYTGSARPQIFAFRPAPIQVNYLGYPGTLGVDYIDYMIADEVIAPMSHQNYYSEKIVHLSDTYQPNDTQRQIAAIPTRAECGLPDNAFVFCCFNSTYKILPPVFDIWMRLLHAVPNSVLWLFEANPLVKDNLHREAKARGIPAERIIFAPGKGLEEHLARHACADLFLDTLPINAHTTTSDALWAGLPVLTCLGESFAGRVAASLVKAAGLPELVTENLQDYEALALRLATSPAELKILRERLQKNRLTVPLFDIQKFTVNLEKAYSAMWERLVTAAPPEVI